MLACRTTAAHQTSDALSTGRYSPPGQASSPVPSNGATNVSLTQDLSWTAGSGATSHDVYFGTANPPPFIVNQAGTTYDTGTMTASTTYYWRIDEKNASGTTTGTVWSFTTVSAPDTTPPTPNPMTWATVPTATGSNSITMTATTATDATPPVQYYFECTNHGEANSTWQTSTTYAPAGLTPNTLYSFRVKARDNAAAQNQTGWSSTQSATTWPPDTTPPMPNPMTWATVPTATGSNSITMTATTATDANTPPVQYYFECTNHGEANSAWQSSATYLASGLTPSTSYTFRTKARDSAPALNQTGWSDTASATTQTPPTDINIIGSWATGTTHTKVSGTNRALIFIAHAERTGAISLNSVKYGGKTMTKVIDKVVSSNDYYAYVAAFILNEANIVDSNSSGTFEPNWSAAPDTGNAAYGSVFLSNVNQTTPAGPNDSNAMTLTTPAQATIKTNPLSTSDGDMVIDAATCGNTGDYTLYNGFTEVLEHDMTSSTGTDGYKFATGANETPSAQHTNVNRQVIIGFVVKTAGGAVPPPGQASSPTPANGATNVSLTQDISWTAGSGATSHDVYFGTVNPPPFIGNQAGTTYDTGTMTASTTYYWRIDEKNAGGTTTGTVWSFTTVPPAPGAATSPNPADSATNVSLTQDISWTAGSGATSHDVYFGTVNPPPFIGNQTGTTYDTGTMASITTYYWRIDEKNAGGTTTGTVWSFTTLDATSPTPNPMIWAIEPNAISSSSIGMTATTATDISGVPAEDFKRATGYHN